MFLRYCSPRCQDYNLVCCEANLALVALLSWSVSDLGMISSEMEDLSDERGEYSCLVAVIVVEYVLP